MLTSVGYSSPQAHPVLALPVRLIPTSSCSLSSFPPLVWLLPFSDPFSPGTLDLSLPPLLSLIILLSILYPEAGSSCASARRPVHLAASTPRTCLSREGLVSLSRAWELRHCSAPSSGSHSPDTQGTWGRQVVPLPVRLHLFLPLKGGRPCKARSLW